MSKAERTKQFIIEKTAPVFNKKGYYATSLTDITNVTGLTKGSIYGNFKDKDEVALAAYTYNYNRLWTAIKSIINGQTGALEKLLSITNFYRTNWNKLSELGGCPLMNAATEVDDSLEFMRPKVRQTFKSWKQVFVGLLDEGIEQKIFKSNISSDEYATILVAMLEGGILLSKISGKNKDILMVLDRIEQIINEEIKL